MRLVRPQVNTASTAVGVGTATPSSAVRRTGTGTRRRAGTSAWASAWPEFPFNKSKSPEGFKPREGTECTPQGELCELQAAEPRKYLTEERCNDKALIMLIENRLVRVFLGLLLCLGISVEAQSNRGKIEIRPRAGDQGSAFSYDGSYALLIGNSNYDSSEWPDLRLIPQELTKLKTVLEQYGFEIYQDRVHLNVDEDQMEQLVEDFVETQGARQTDSRLLVYYSGHGHTDGRQGFLVTRDAPDPEQDPIGFRSKAVWISDFQQWARKAEAKHVLFCFDSCFAGTVFRSRSRTTPEEISLLTGKPVREFLTAGSADQEVPARGFFTEYFQLGIQGAGDLDRNGYVTGTELFSYLRARVAEATARTTRNEVQFGKLPDPEFEQGDYVFVVPNVQLEDPVPTPVVLSKPMPVLTYGSLVVKSPRTGEVRLDGQGPFPITAGSGLEWKRLVSGVHEIVVTAGGGEFKERVIVREGQRAEVVAWFGGSSGMNKAGEERSDNEIGMVLVYIPEGVFTMGSPASEGDRTSDEDQIQVSLSQGFWLGKYEVTQSEWESVMGSNPSHFKGHRLPVEKVSWEEAVEFCKRLTDWERQEGRLGAGEAYRLPTEAQWEYACRAGTRTAFAFGKALSSREANFDGEYPYGSASEGPYLKMTTEVGSYGGNKWGLHDMHGNVFEWCRDWYHEQLNGGTDPTGAFSGQHRVYRGGSWFVNGWTCRSAFRFWGTPFYRSKRLGFRVARVAIH